MYSSSYNISQYYCFNCSFDQINAELISIRDFFQKTLKNTYRPQTFTVVYILHLNSSVQFIKLLSLCKNVLCLFPLETLEQNPIYTDEELREFEEHLAREEQDLNLRTNDLMKQREDLERQQEQLNAQKMELQQVGEWEIKRNK